MKQMFNNIQYFMLTSFIGFWNRINVLKWVDLVM